MSTRCTSPLESLAAAAIAFAAGALSLSLISAWGNWKERQGARAASGEASVAPEQKD